jgi:hypothetical protein
VLFGNVEHDDDLLLALMVTDYGRFEHIAK